MKRDKEGRLCVSEIFFCSHGADGRGGGGASQGQTGHRGPQPQEKVEPLTRVETRSEKAFMLSPAGDRVEKVCECECVRGFQVVPLDVSEHIWTSGESLLRLTSGIPSL